MTGPLQDLDTPPYDVIDPMQREMLATRSPYNAVHVDLPEGGEDVYETAAGHLAQWLQAGALVRDDEDALWAIVQEYTSPSGESLTRRGLFARVRVEEYGAGKIRPHERTHPGPKEDRCASPRHPGQPLPIFSLYDDPAGAAWRALNFLHEPAVRQDLRRGRHLHRCGIADPDAIAKVRAALEPASC